MAWYGILALSLAIWFGLAIALALLVGRVVSANRRAGYGVSEGDWVR